jgi:hypothetical protein
MFVYICCLLLKLILAFLISLFIILSLSLFKQSFFKIKKKSSPVQMRELENKLEADEEEDSDVSMPTEVHQDITRSLNLQATLVEALMIDYNLSFKGSICSSEEKVQSRVYLVEVQRRFMEVLIHFVTANETNQTLVFTSAIKFLTNHLGPLQLPEVYPEDFPEALKLQLPVSPGMNAESVVIECLRGNEHLCSEVVTRELFVTFGHLLNEFPDPSISPVLEFFEIVCCPCGKAILRNQSITVDVFMSDDLPNLKNCVTSIFTNGSQCAAPERIAKLLCACIVEGNIQTASQLQRNRLTMDSNLVVLEGFINKVQENPDVVDEAFLGEMLQLLSLMMEILVVDPRLYRRISLWDIVTIINKHVLCKFSNAVLNKHRRTLDFKKRVKTAVACAKISTMVITGARSLGLFEMESRYDPEIRSDVDSILNSGVEIYKSDVIASDKELSNVFEALVDAIDVTKLGDSNVRRGRASSMVDIRAASVAQPTESSLVSALPNPLAVVVAAGKKGAAVAGNLLDVDNVEEEGIDLSSIDHYEDPITMLSYFDEALWNNPHVRVVSLILSLSLEFLFLFFFFSSLSAAAAAA